MSVGEEYTPDQFYDMIVNPEKLKSYNGIKKAMDLFEGMDFQHNMPYEEIKTFIGEEMEAIFSKVPTEVISSAGLQWEHVGSTSIKGMPGTIFPDVLILFKVTSSPPREVFDSLMENNFEFVGSGPFHPKDIWFLKKISRKGSRLDGACFKIHFTPANLGPSRHLMETRDRCNNNPEDFEDYKRSKVEAAHHLDSGNIIAYKVTKGSSKLLQELSEKHGMTQPSLPAVNPLGE